MTEHVARSLSHCPFRGGTRLPAPKGHRFSGSPPHAARFARKGMLAIAIPDWPRPLLCDELVAVPVHREDVLRLVRLCLDFSSKLDDEVVDGAVGRAGL